mmetsp:Transcript_39577/g.89779  ORF Transcript_39577/g.89779 Transcript_39577/m.89779 type:complete len:202 (-) Transcript_39577:684-1289(-)
MDQPNKEKDKYHRTTGTAESKTEEHANPKRKTPRQGSREPVRRACQPKQEEKSLCRIAHAQIALQDRSTPKAQELYHRPPKARDNPPTDRDLTSASHLKLLVHVPKSNDCRRPPCSPRHSPLLQASSSPLGRLSWPSLPLSPYHTWHHTLHYDPALRAYGPHPSTRSPPCRAPKRTIHSTGTATSPTPPGCPHPAEFRSIR